MTFTFHKVVSVSMRLRCDGILNDLFITQSLLSPRVKKIWESVNICRSYGQLSIGSFFIWNTVQLRPRYIITLSFAKVFTLYTHPHTESILHPVHLLNESLIYLFHSSVNLTHFHKI